MVYPSGREAMLIGNYNFCEEEPKSLATSSRYSKQNSMLSLH